MIRKGLVGVQGPSRSSESQKLGTTEILESRTTQVISAHLARANNFGDVDAGVESSVGSLRVAETVPDEYDIESWNDLCVSCGS